MTAQQQNKELRKFGLIVGSVFLIIAVWPLILHGADMRLWAVAVGGLLSVLGAFVPSMLRPIHKGWMFIGHVMGWINTRVILGIFFYTMLTPMGLLARAMGKNLLHLKPVLNADTYRVLRTPRDTTHFRRQF
jgi:hypothetical protein